MIEMGGQNLSGGASKATVPPVLAQNEGAAPLKNVTGPAVDKFTINLNQQAAEAGCDIASYAEQRELIDSVKTPFQQSLSSLVSGLKKFVTAAPIFSLGLAVGVGVQVAAALLVPGTVEVTIPPIIFQPVISLIGEVVRHSSKYLK